MPPVERAAARLSRKPTDLAALVERIADTHRLAMTGRPAALSALAFASTARVAEGVIAAKRAETRERGVVVTLLWSHGLVGEGNYGPYCESSLPRFWGTTCVC